jgi:hypothetical protein
LKTVFFSLLLILFTVSSYADVLATDGFCKIETNIAKEPWGKTDLAVTLNGYIINRWRFEKAGRSLDGNYDDAIKAQNESYIKYAQDAFTGLQKVGLCSHLPATCNNDGQHAVIAKKIVVNALPGTIPFTDESVLQTIQKLHDYGVCTN